MIHFTKNEADELPDITTFNKIKSSYVQLKAFCEAEDYKGWDPYDGLNSKFFNRIPGIKYNRLFRLAWVQFFKRSPINLRNLFFVSKEHNNKGLGLFLAGYCKEYSFNPSSEVLKKINHFSGLILENKLVNYSGACWGYNFDWQARAFFQPKNTPTVVATTFISNALLDAFEITGDKALLDTARSSCDFIMKDLNKTFDDENNFAFSYSPLDHSVVFNASLLGSRLLARVYMFTQEEVLLEQSIKSVDFCLKYQRQDGSWEYGTLPFHHWVDNFHTGYNLECIADVMRFSGRENYQNELEKGFDYYIKNFFLDNGISKYYNNCIYPVDIHCPSQLVITLVKLGKFNENIVLLNKVLNWTIDHMQSSGGYFYYQYNKYISSKIPYMRWAQAWMFYGLATYIESLSMKLKKNQA